MASVYGFSVHRIPWEEHHPQYQCDDIELWRVRRTRSLPRTAESRPNGLRIHKFGSELPLIELSLDLSAESYSLCLRQEPEGALGGYVWPSAVVLSRYLVSDRGEHLFRRLRILPSRDTVSIVELGTRFLARYAVVSGCRSGLWVDGDRAAGAGPQGAAHRQSGGSSLASRQHREKPARLLARRGVARVGLAIVQ